MAEAVALNGVSKSFGSGPAAHAVLRGVDLRIAPGEFVALLGASGCGKSTLLRLIGGLETPTGGEVRLGSGAVTGADPRCSMVFQEPRLFPWKTVAANVQLGARRGGGAFTPEAILERVGLAGYANAWPHQLSGGMAQRVGLARALAGQPRVLLLDEPFAALDALNRLRMQDVLVEAFGDLAPTVVMVTHDVDEAIRLAHRIVIIGGQPANVRAEHLAPDRNDSLAVDRMRADILGHFGLGSGRFAHTPEAAIARSA